LRLESNTKPVANRRSDSANAFLNCIPVGQLLSVAQVIKNGARVCEPQHVAAQAGSLFSTLLRLTEPRSVLKNATGKKSDLFA
jgi:hypothetical protein